MNNRRQSNLIRQCSRHFYASLIVPLSLLALPAATQAQFTYVTNSGTITITGYTGPGGAVTIPGTITGRPVTIIGDSAFSFKLSMTSVAIPDSVTSIASRAFSGCFNLTNVTIGNSVISIGDNAFSDCFSLTSVAIPSSVTSISSYAFFKCAKLTAITVDPLNAVYSSVDGVLFNLSQTTLVECPAGKAGSYTIPDSVTSIGPSALYYCTNLTSVLIPKSVSGIGQYAFSFCTSLSAIAVDSLNPFYVSVAGVLFDKSQTMLIQYPGGRTGSYTVPDSVTNIGMVAFYGCSLTRLTIPNSVTSLGWGAFSDCYSLTSVTLDEGVTSLNGYTFYGCTSLTNVAIPESVRRVGPYEFGWCTSLTRVTIPNGLTNIGDYMFYECSSLTSVYFKGNAPSIGSSVFYNNNKATVYYLPGTTGWGSTFGGRPARLWNPQAQTGDDSFGVRSNRFGFTITGTTNIPIVVEAGTNLAGGSWISLQTCTITNGSIYFCDPNWTNHPARFYRIRSP